MITMVKPVFHEFECQMYVSRRDILAFGLPNEPGPRRLIKFSHIDHDELIDPGFRRLLAAFESLPQSLRVVQV